MIETRTRTNQQAAKFFLLSAGEPRSLLNSVRGLSMAEAPRNRRGSKGALYLKTLQDVKTLLDLHGDLSKPRSKSWDIIEPVFFALHWHKEVIYCPLPTMGGAICTGGKEWLCRELAMRRALAGIDIERFKSIRAQGSFTEQERETSKRLAAAVKIAWPVLVSEFPLAAIEACFRV